MVLKLIRRLYDWVLHWADTPYGTPVLAGLAFIESSFFPIPPDPLLLALALGKPSKAFRFALYCTIFSALGGLLGYAIGYYLMDAIGFPIINMYGAMEKYDTIGELYRKYDAIAVGLAGFTPLPYKVFTITAGAFHINFFVFAVASFISRGLRFFILAGLIKKFGKPVKEYIDKYFGILTLVFAVLLVGGFALIKLLF